MIGPYRPQKLPLQPVDREDIDVPAVMRNDISEHDAPFCSDS